MARLSKAEKLIESECDRCFTLHGQNIQFNIFDLGKITQAGKNAAKAGTSIEEAIKAAIQVYRKN